ncbi:Vitamin B12 transporter BtuB (Cobalamin receptor) (Outer membrane cobalamin translocator) [Durusdinium trenchii]|uniref:Vitamin B12 transporter BtuB (Cobalamin receptor) (Outer membrane cobalamin translocator) n=1 Tax=Durusdinium trenchii TaxID=1381693 RepID=A0ABP0LTB6_9DINO
MRRGLLTATALSGVAAASAPAFAQDQSDTIIVTGSRLDQANLNSSSPVFQVDAAEIDTRGATRVEDLVNILPQAFAAQTSTLANGANGTSTLNLRGLGSVRTLVLMDGKRLPFGGPEAGSSANNLDLIPAQLVERVDIVTGGASAVYGSDALAGVANFILRRDFEGIEFDGQVGFFQDGNNGDFANALLGVSNIDAPGGQTDGRSVNASILFGANTADGRGNVTAFFQYQDQNEVRQDARDFSTCAMSPTPAGPLSIGGIGCSGSTTFRRFNLGGAAPTPLQSTGPLGQPQQVAVPAADSFLEEDGTLVPFSSSNPTQLFNFAPDNFLQRPNERFNASFFARYELTDNIEAYMDFGYTENRTDAQIAFTGTFFRPFQVNCANPFLGDSSDAGSLFTLAGCGNQVQQQVFNPDGTPFADPVLDDMGNPTFDPDTGDPITQDLFEPLVDGSGDPVTPTDIPISIGYRNVTGDPRNSFIDLQTFRVVGGFRGTIGDNWNWDAFGQFSRTRQTLITEGDLNFNRVQEALFVVDSPNGPVCRTPNSGSCIPFNVFQNNVTREAALSAQGNGFRNGNVEQKVIGATLAGDLSQYGFQFPWTDNGIQALVGAEWREDQLESQPDDISQIPGGRGLTGRGGGTLPVQGEVSVWELFMETQIPLIEGKPFIEEFGINGAYRFSNYTVEGNNTENDFETHTFAAGVTWSPTPDVRFRGQFQRAVRAPNVVELFTGQNTGLFNASAGPNGLFDPCAGDLDPSTSTPAPSATAAQCAFTGLPANLFGTVQDNTAGQLNSVSGGNPLLSPESSDTYSVGAIITPRIVPGLTVAIDYFDITIQDAISTIPPQTTLTQCVQNGTPQFCDLITRDRFGSLFLDNANFEGILATNINISDLSTRGLDVATTYSLDMADLGLDGWGQFNWNLAGTYLFEAAFVPIPGVTVATECAGFFAGGCQSTGVGAYPEWKHRLLTTWQTPWNIDVTATWRFFSGTDNISALGPNGSGPTGNVLDDSLDSANFLDLAAQFYVRENVAIRAGVNNVFGRDPDLQTPIGTAPGNGNTLPGIYDPLGRFIFFGVNISM